MFYQDIELYQKKICNVSIPIILFSINKYNVIGQHPNDRTKPINYYSYKKDMVNNISITQPIFFLYFNGTNVAHSICQLIKSHHEYKQLGKNLTILVSQSVKEMRFLKKLILILFPQTKIDFLKEDLLYKFSSIYIPKYIWFTESCPYQYMLTNYDNIVTKIFDTNVPLPKEYGILYDPITYFNQVTEQLYHANKHKYTVYENIFLIKSNVCTDSQTPRRAITLNNPENILKKYNYHMILPHTIKDVIQHIVLLRAAKNIVTSYGGANCINRFFFNPDAVVKLICNQHYSDEYTNDSHIQASIYKAKKYICFIDIPNKLDNDLLEKIFKFELEA